MADRFEMLQQQAQEAFAEGDLRQAVQLFGEAEDFAQAQGWGDLADRAFCNRCAVLIELDDAKSEIPRLKRLILGSNDLKNRWMASYYTAMAYDLDGELDKATPYARRACEIARSFDDPAMTARCANLAGTLALRSSCFEDAETSYREAVEAHRDLDGYHRIYEAQAKDNLGYVLMCTDRLSEGVHLCEEALTALEQTESEMCVAQTLQDLCYGYLLEDELDQARKCGEQALDLAVETTEALVVKNVLFLLSEIAIRAGDTFRARRYLRELAEHYPEVGVSEEIIDVFLATDLTAVVNLRG